MIMIILIEHLIDSIDVNPHSHMFLEYKMIQAGFFNKGKLKKNHKHDVT